MCHCLPGFDLYEHIIFLGGRSAQFTRMNLCQFRNPRLTVQAMNWMKMIMMNQSYHICQSSDKLLITIADTFILLQ